MTVYDFIVLQHDNGCADVTERKHLHLDQLLAPLTSSPCSPTTFLLPPLCLRPLADLFSCARGHGTSHARLFATSADEIATCVNVAAMNRSNLGGWQAHAHLPGERFCIC